MIRLFPNIFIACHVKDKLEKLNPSSLSLSYAGFIISFRFVSFMSLLIFIVFDMRIMGSLNTT